MFYVYSGYVTPDRHDASEGPVYTLREFKTTQEVIQAHKEFLQEFNDECSGAIFKVISGDECELQPKRVVEDYSLKMPLRF